MRKTFLLIVPFLFFPLLALADTDHLVISQVQITGGSGKTTNDFVEIYNPTSSDIDLKGFRLVKRTKTGTSDTSLKSWTASTIIKAHGFYLWANSAFTDITTTADVTTTGSISDDNAVALRNGPNDTGTIVDALGWGAAANTFVEGSAYASNPTANQSLERSPGGDSGNGTDTNNNSADFFLQAVAHPRNSQAAAMPPIVSEPAAVTPTTPAATPVSEIKYSTDIVISEFLPNPDGPDAGKEWVELYNNSPSEVDLSKWILDSQATTKLLSAGAYTFPSGAKIAGQGFFVFNLPEDNFLLNNTGGDTLRLFWPNKTLLTQATFTDNAYDDETYARKPDATYAWTNLATKGRANQFASTLDGIVSAAETRIKISEVFPGGWVELANTGTEPILIHNWTVDDGKPGSAIGSSSWKIESPTLTAGGVAVLIIPADNFTLDKTSDNVRLFNENNILIDTVSYSDAQEGMSYAWFDNGWTWMTPTPNATNVFIADESKDVLVPAPTPAVVYEQPVKKSVSLAVAPPLPPQVASLPIPTPPVGVVSGASITNEAVSNNNKMLWLWLALSFAINLAFCYILIRVMLRHTRSE